MMADNIREKLVELLMKNELEFMTYRTNKLIDAAIGGGPVESVLSRAAFTAGFLLANGVTVQEWISVKDGLPKLIPCDAGTAYSEAVNVLTSGRKVLTAIWDGFDWICDAEFWDAEDEKITHWTPVLLPLPMPPKGE